MFLQSVGVGEGCACACHMRRTSPDGSLVHTVQYFYVYLRLSRSPSPSADSRLFPSITLTSAWSNLRRKSRWAGRGRRAAGVSSWGGAWRARAGSGSDDLVSESTNTPHPPPPPSGSRALQGSNGFWKCMVLFCTVQFQTRAHPLTRRYLNNWRGLFDLFTLRRENGGEDEVLLFWAKDKTFSPTGIIGKKGLLCTWARTSKFIASINQTRRSCEHLEIDNH